MMPRRSNSNKRKSFFEEQRDISHNPSFMANLDPATLRQNVKRIIKDINDDIITTDDYRYFKSNNIIYACIQESYEQWMTSRCIKNALTFYRSIAIPRGLITLDVDVNTELTTSAMELNRMSIKESLWGTAYNLFLSVFNGADPIKVLPNFMRFSKQDLRLL